MTRRKAPARPRPSAKPRRRKNPTRRLLRLGVDATRPVVRSNPSPFDGWIA